MDYVTHFFSGMFAMLSDYYAVMHQFWSHPQFLRLWPAVFFLLVPFIMWNWARRQSTVRHSSVEIHGALRKGAGRAWIVATCLLLGAASVSWNMALMAPVVPDKVVEHLVQTRNVCEFVDRSGSMETVLLDGQKELTDLEGSTNNDPSAVKAKNGGNDKMLVQSPEKAQPAHPMTRIEGAQMAARIFIHTLMSYNAAETNHFCIFSFDVDSYLMVPLTSDKTVAELRTVHITENTGGGTNFAGPCGYSSGIGPLRKAYDYFTKYTGPESIRVDFMVTDGYDDIDPSCAKDLKEKFLQAHIKLYVVGLGEGWKEGNTLDLQKFADDLRKVDPTNGKVFRASNPKAMHEAIDAINASEKAQEVVANIQLNREIYDYFGATNLLFLGLFAVLVAFMRKNP